MGRRGIHRKRGEMDACQYAVGMFWHVEQRDACYPLDCWTDIRLLMTDTPGPGQGEEQMTRDVLEAWLQKMPEHSTALVFSHVQIEDPRVIQSDHSRYGRFQELIELYTKPGDIVADPFCGSSSFGVTAIQLGRSYIGTDIQRTQVEASFKALTERKVDGT